MNIKNILIILTIAIFSSSCFPEKLDIVAQEEFILSNMDPIEFPVVIVSPKNGGTKTFVIYASHHTDSIARFVAEEQSHDFVVSPVSCKLIDPTKPVEVNSEGFLSRKLSSTVFTYKVTIPKTFREGIYSVKFSITTGKGNVKSLVAKCRAVNFLQATNVLTLFNGQTKTNLRTYLSTAPCFVRFITNMTTVMDSTVSPPVTLSIPTSITASTMNAATAITSVNYPNVYGHIYANLADFDKRSVYLVSPNTPWIADSLRILNSFTGTYPTALMNNVKYVDMGVIDFINLNSSDFDNIPFDTKGESMVQLIDGHSYAFNITDGRVGIMYIKKIMYYSPNYTGGSPIVYMYLKVQADPPVSN